MERDHIEQVLVPYERLSLLCAKARPSVDGVGVVIQARMGSERLPGKVMMDIGAAISMLGLILHRFRSLFPECPIIVSTTHKREDDVIEETVRTFPHVGIYRGSELDVLDRYYQTCKKFHLATCIRVTADCPFVDPSLIRYGLAVFQEKNRQRLGTCVYLSNTLKRTFPRGFDFEICSYDVLERAYKEAKDQFEREHVTPFIYRNPALFPCISLEVEQKACACNIEEWRLTVDTPDDVKLIRCIVESMLHTDSQALDYAGVYDIIQFIEDRPEWKKINQHVCQKT